MENIQTSRKKERLSAIITGDPTSSSLSVNKVVSIEDLLTEILLRLPVRSLLRFKSVCKYWYSLITSPSFKLLRKPHFDCPSGLFVPMEKRSKFHLEYDFVPLDIENPVKSPFRTRDFDSEAARIEIIHSSNGLMLCHSLNVEASQKSSLDVDFVERCYAINDYYYIHNPTLNQFATISKPRYYHYQTRLFYDFPSQFCMTLAFDPSRSPHYRILYVYDLGSNEHRERLDYLMEIYSSETRTWQASCRFSLESDIIMDFRAGVYWNDAIHWIHGNGFVLCFKFHEGKVNRIQTPPGDLGDETHSKYIFESRGCMLLVDVLVDIFFPLASYFTIYELKENYSGWSVKYHVDLGEVSREFSEIKNPWDRITFDFAVQLLVLGEKEENSFLVLEIPGKAVRYNLISKTFHKLFDFTPSHCNNVEMSRNFRRWPNVYQFIETLYSL